IIKSDELIEILKVLESYIFRRIMCKAPTNALNKVFMNLNREIKKIPRYEEHYVDILKYVLINKKSSQRFPSEEEFKINFLECNVYNWKSKNKVYLLEKLENYDNNERVDIENLVNDKSLSIEHIMPQTLSLNWKKSLGENYSEIHAKYIGTIGNLTLTGYNSSLSNKSFIEKRDMKKGFKDSRLKLNKYLVDIDKWDEDTIKRRAENLFEIATNVWEYPISNYSLDNENNNLFSLEDDDDFTNTKVDKFIFKEDAIKVRNWTELYEKVLLGLYEVNPLPFSRLAKKEFSQEYLNRRFSNKERELRTPLKIDNNLYVEKNLSTESKLQTLRIIFDEYGIEYSELLFNIK
ncbi:HNH endonuclease family protein, partial [Clostridium perfringens]